ncbi:hypothetical protein [Polyangium sp. 15x6]|uniref:hypothetical protein n=1 Tax=Polyangium sp. 15x6 TaxID=3042687 RepID=UPI00249C726D|nr:hypothetical protein [Polyangium sp. 15x6]MDI3281954.1 hypothetical protein [Polyangium sp. 15x6]
MTTTQRTHLISRFGFAGALVASALVFPACGGEPVDVEDFEGEVGEAEQATGPTGANNLPPFAIDSDPLARSVTDAHGITSTTNPDPLPLCKNGTVTATGCTLKPEWESWMAADATNRGPMMKGIAKCSISTSFTITTNDGTLTFPGQWELYPNWKTNRLTGEDKRERVSSCLLSLLNGNNLELAICIVGPGGAPFSTPCSDPRLTIREGGFYGNLFATNPTAYVAGPDTADPVDSGRACFGSQGNYCCAENDTNCNHRIVLTGAILGSPDQNFANKRCNAPLVDAGGGHWYCPSFFSTREPNRSYTNVFTTFVPPAQ